MEEHTELTENKPYECDICKKNLEFHIHYQDIGYTLGKNLIIVMFVRKDLENAAIFKIINEHTLDTNLLNLMFAKGIFTFKSLGNP
jgi:hypothetical protein